MKHSPEPWRIDEEDCERPFGDSSVNGACSILDANGKGIVPDTPWIPTGFDRDRIVACVNACAGVPTKRLAEMNLQKAVEILDSRQGNIDCNDYCGVAYSLTRRT